MSTSSHAVSLPDNIARTALMTCSSIDNDAVIETSCLPAKDDDLVAHCRGCVAPSVQRTAAYVLQITTRSRGGGDQLHDCPKFKHMTVGLTDII